MLFQYTARSLAGEAASGILDAETLAVARQQLRERGLFPMSLKPSLSARSMAAVSKSPSWMTRVSRHDLMLFTSQLVIMLRSGTELADALRGLAATCTNPKLKQVLEAINEDISGGVSFSSAMRRQAATFGEAYVASVAAGDASGKVPEVLLRLEEMLRNEIKLRSIVLGAISYPIVLTGVCCIVIAALVLFVLPNFEKVFSDMGVSPPASTQVLFFVCGGLRRQWWLWGGVAAAVAAIGYRVMRTRQGRRVIDGFLLRITVFGDVIQSLVSGRIFGMMGMMLQNGVPMVQALQLCQASVRSSCYKDILEQLQTEVLNGRRLGPILTATHIIPPGCAQMITTAEQSGSLGTVMQLVGEYYEAEAQRKVQELAKLLEPIIIIVMGVIVAFVVASVMLPMLDISSAAGT